MIEFLQKLGDREEKISQIFRGFPKFRENRMTNANNIGVFN